MNDYDLDTDNNISLINNVDGEHGIDFDYIPLCLKLKNVKFCQKIFLRYCWT